MLGRVGEADLAHAHLVLEEVDHLPRAVGLGLPFDSRVDVLGVLAEDDHVGLRRVAQRARNAGEVAHRPQADEEVELLAQRHVERAEAAADRRRQRALDRDRVLARGVERLVGEPDVAAVEPRRLLARVDLQPVDLPRAAVGLLDGRVDDRLHHRRDVDPDPVALDERDDRVVGRRLARHDPRAAGWNLDVRLGAHSPTVCSWAWRVCRRNGPGSRRPGRLSQPFRHAPRGSGRLADAPRPARSPRSCSKASTGTTASSARRAPQAKEHFEAAAWAEAQQAVQERIRFYDERVARVRRAPPLRVRRRVARDRGLAGGEALLHRPARRPLAARARRDVLQLGDHADAAPHATPTTT